LEHAGSSEYYSCKHIHREIERQPVIPDAVFFSGPLGGEIYPPKFEISPPNRQA